MEAPSGIMYPEVSESCCPVSVKAERLERVTSPVLVPELEPEDPLLTLAMA